MTFLLLFRNVRERWGRPFSFPPSSKTGRAAAGQPLRFFRPVFTFSAYPGNPCIPSSCRYARTKRVVPIVHFRIPGRILLFLPQPFTSADKGDGPIPSLQVSLLDVLALPRREVRQGIKIRFRGLFILFGKPDLVTPRPSSSSSKGLKGTAPAQLSRYTFTTGESLRTAHHRGTDM